MSVHFRLSLIGLAGLVFATGCNALMPSSVMNLTAASAENPLHGRPISWSRGAQGTPLSGQSGCTTWPIEDELTVTATDAELCVAGKIHHLVDAALSGNEESSLSIVSDGEGGGILGAPQVTARSHKVGSCSDQTSTKNVWVAEYNSCAPNKDAAGKQNLSAKSTFLQVGDARWKFPAPASTTTTTSAAASAAAPASKAPASATPPGPSALQPGSLGGPMSKKKKQVP